MVWSRGNEPPTSETAYMALQRRAIGGLKLGFGVGLVGLSVVGIGKDSLRDDIEDRMNCRFIDLSKIRLESMSFRKAKAGRSCEWLIHLSAEQFNPSAAVSKITACCESDQ